MCQEVPGATLARCCRSSNGCGWPPEKVEALIKDDLKALIKDDLKVLAMSREVTTMEHCADVEQVAESGGGAGRRDQAPG